MKKLFAALVLCASNAFAGQFVDFEWRLNDHNAAVILAEAYVQNQTAMFFYPCNMTLTLWDEQYNDISETQTFSAKVKVDNNEVHYLSFGFSQRVEAGNSFFTTVSTEITGVLLEQMVAGKYIRVQYKNSRGEWSDKIIERYSLNGFTKAARESLDTCGNGGDAEYFSNTKSDKDYF